MEINELEAALEAILFASGDPVPMDKLCNVLEIDRGTLDKIAKIMEDYYSYNSRI